MRNLAKTFVWVTACLAVTASASGATVPPNMLVNPSMPFVSVSMQQEPVEIGTFYGPGAKSSLFQLYAHVVANCPYHVAASFQSFKHVHGKAVISAKDLSVAVNNKPIPIGAGRASVVHSPKPTPLSGVEVPLALLVKVQGMDRYPQGPYRGALVITVMAGP